MSYERRRRRAAQLLNSFPFSNELQFSHSFLISLLFVPPILFCSNYSSHDDWNSKLCTSKDFLHTKKAAHTHTLIKTTSVNFLKPTTRWGLLAEKCRIPPRGKRMIMTTTEERRTPAPQTKDKIAAPKKALHLKRTPVPDARMILGRGYKLTMCRRA